MGFILRKESDMKSVLLVDKDNQSNDNITLLFSQYEIKTKVAKTGGEALDLWKQESFLFILLACIIEERVLLKLRSFQVPLIALVSRKEDLKFFLENDFEDYLKKPVQKEDFYYLFSGYGLLETKKQPLQLAGAQIAGAIEKEELMQALEELSYSLENHQLEQAELYLYQLAQRSYCDEKIMECLHRMEEYFLTDRNEFKILEELYGLIQRLE